MFRYTWMSMNSKWQHVLQEPTASCGAPVQGELLATSNAVPLEFGTFGGYCLTFALDGLQLDAGEYEISTYVSDLETEVGNRSRTRHRETEAARYTLSQEEVGRIARKRRLTKEAQYECRWCLDLGDTAAFTVSRSNGQLEIERGVNYIASIEWSVGGYYPDALVSIGDGAFVAEREAQAYGQVILIAVDTESGDIDSVGITIFREDANVVPCTETNSQVWIQTNPSATNTIVAAKARIKSRYGELCGNPRDPGRPAAVVFVGVLDTVNGTWAQAGNVNIRIVNRYDAPALYHARSIEVQGFNPGIFQINDLRDTSSVPLEGSVHEYRVELNPDSAVWIAYYDGSEYQKSDPDSAWQGRGGNAATWRAEVIHEESDMAGTILNKCFITACSLMTTMNWNYEYVPLTGVRRGSDDPGEWLYELENDTFYIWDMYPMGWND